MWECQKQKLWASTLCEASHLLGGLIYDFSYYFLSFLFFISFTSWPQPTEHRWASAMNICTNISRAYLTYLTYFTHSALFYVHVYLWNHLFVCRGPVVLYFTKKDSFFFGRPVPQLPLAGWLKRNTPTTVFRWTFLLVCLHSQNTRGRWSFLHRSIIPHHCHLYTCPLKQHDALHLPPSTPTCPCPQPVRS